MSRVALLSDVHGNASALAAVLGEIARSELDGIVCLGDIAAGGPQPREVISLLRDLGCLTIRGNADAWLTAGFPPGKSAETISCGETSVLCFHGSPRSNVEGLLATTPESEIEEALVDAKRAKVLAGGHTHLQLLRRLGDRVLVNPGSVGLPLGSLRARSGGQPLPTWAEYALLECEGEVDATVTFRRVAVDPEALAEPTASMPHATWAIDLERRIRRWNRR
jgi:putative phosphoesterase